jgi:hypothetical protein
VILTRYEEWVDEPDEVPYRVPVRAARTDEEFVLAVLEGMLGGYSVLYVLGWVGMGLAEFHSVRRRVADSYALALLAR